MKDWTTTNWRSIHKIYSEQQIEPEAQLQLSMQERASIVPTEVLYHSRRDDVHHRVYVHRSEEAILVTDNHQVDRSFIQEESFNQLRRSRMQYIHLGVLLVRIQILHRQREGTMTLIVFRDNRWLGDQAILTTMEVDLTNGSQMIYVIPETMLTIGDFYRNIQISILTRGYEAWHNSEANLLITRGPVGRLSNTPNVGFVYEIQGLVDYLTSHGVNALPGRNFSTRSLQGLNWVINPTQTIIPMQPSKINSQTMMDGQISLSFSNYAAVQPSEQPTYNNKDEEIQEILAVLIEAKQEVSTNYKGTADESDEEYAKMRNKGKKSLNTQQEVLPKRQTEGSAGLDIKASHAAVIEPYGRDLIHTGLRIEIPYGYYGRIASRSGLTWNYGIEVGAGVIDSDYRGEIQVLLFNQTNVPVFISPQQNIAQLILEKIALLEVHEVSHLSQIEHGDKGFGSTDKPLPIKHTEATTSQPQYFMTRDVFSLLLPRESTAVLVQDDSIQNNSEKDHAATTSPWASVPRSMAPTLNYEDTDDSYLDYIQYLTTLSTTNQPIWDPYPDFETDWINPFSEEEEASVFRIFIDEPGYGDLHWQFGSQDGSSETQVIDYKTQQSRLFPLLDSAYAFRFVGQWLKWIYNDVIERLRANDFSTLPEAHACTAGLKSLTTSVTTSTWKIVIISKFSDCIIIWLRPEDEE
ncbi:hypothetical protein ZIOFF_051265 [Zingiber officinale]|uniref:dUTP diphosphatase n=1 Tax=Zingiber officinale TaxID=94328 RepID=A0A8J5FMF8_ZINOF|nr:hypothetical protein ZIOFF_051265 [Zingiber officinale]